MVPKKKAARYADEGTNWDAETRKYLQGLGEADLHMEKIFAILKMAYKIEFIEERVNADSKDGETWKERNIEMNQVLFLKAGWIEKRSAAVKKAAMEQWMAEMKMKAEESKKATMDQYAVKLMEQLDTELEATIIGSWRINEEKVNK